MATDPISSHLPSYKAQPVESLSSTKLGRVFKILIASTIKCSNDSFILVVAAATMHVFLGCLPFFIIIASMFVSTVVIKLGKMYSIEPIDRLKRCTAKFAERYTQIYILSVAACVLIYPISSNIGIGLAIASGVYRRLSIGTKLNDKNCMDYNYAAEATIIEL